MGKPYQRELESLESTYEWARLLPIPELDAFTSKAIESGLITIGSGGSLTSASLAAILHESFGRIGKATTPLQFASEPTAASGSSVLILSAGGRNPDVLEAFRAAISNDCRHVFSLCTRRQSRLAQMSLKYEIADSLEAEPPCGKDGFLATNSLLATCTMLVRAYAEAKCEVETLPLTLEELAPVCSGSTSASVEHHEATWLVLYGRLGVPAAYDVESKFAEAALGNVLISDYRNFAHGRHHWLTKRGTASIILALSTPEDDELATRTLGLLPKSVPVVKLEAINTGWLGALELVVKVLRFVGQLGEALDIDPGRPKVAPFGRRLYHLRPQVIAKGGGRSAKAERQRVAIQRKRKSTSGFPTSDLWTDAYREFRRGLQRARFGAIVFDYDGTLCRPEERFDQLSTPIRSHLRALLRAGVIIGIATGRGKSVRESLRKVIPKKFFSQVLVGYYNGAVIGDLGIDDAPNNDIQFHEAITRAHDLLQCSEHLLSVATVEARPFQLTITPHNTHSRDYTKSLIQSLLIRGECDVRYVESSHSLDILAPNVSKLRLLQQVQQRLSALKAGLKVVCIGDMGEFPGNDGELLTHNYSLSVAEVSSDPICCWNLAAPGRRGVEVTLEYLSWIEFATPTPGKKSHFRLKVGV